MYYNILWIPAKPYNYRNGITHLKKLAQITHDEHGLASRVYSPFATGAMNMLGFVTPHESVTAVVNEAEAVGQSASFEAWANESREILDMGSAEWQLCRILRSGGGNATANFLNTFAIDIKPGHMQPGREMLNTVADHFESIYSRTVDVLSLEGGLHYRHYIVVSYDDLDQYDDVQTALNTDEVYATWSVDVLEMIDARTIEKNIGRYL